VGSNTPVSVILQQKRLSNAMLQSQAGRQLVNLHVKDSLESRNSNVMARSVDTDTIVV